MCQRSTLRFFNVQTGEFFEKGCCAYRCPECGPKKVFKLRKSLEEQFKSWSMLGFWTLTISSSVVKDKVLHYKILTQCYQRLIQELRRSGKVNDKSFKYFRVNELHKSGFSHIHVCFDNWFDWEYIADLWRSLLVYELNQYGIPHNRYFIGGAFAKGKKSINRAASYVCKYITKTARRMNVSTVFKRFYSKSNNVVLFPVKYVLEGKEYWICLFMRGNLQKVLLGLKTLCITPQYITWLEALHWLSDENIKYLWSNIFPFESFLNDTKIN